MQHHRLKIALAAVAALLLAHGTTHAQMTGSFGHYGDFSSAQGAPAQFSATAPGQYASGQYVYVGPWTYPLNSMDQTRPYRGRIVRYDGRNIYFLNSGSNSYEPVRYPVNPSQPTGSDNGSGGPQSNSYRSYAPGSPQTQVAPRSANPYGPAQGWTNDMSRYHYDRGFQAGYDAGLSNAVRARTQTTNGPNPFGAY